MVRQRDICVGSGVLRDSVSSADIDPEGDWGTQISPSDLVDFEKEIVVADLKLFIDAKHIYKFGGYIHINMNWCAFHFVIDSMYPIV